MGCQKWEILQGLPRPVFSSQFYSINVQIIGNHKCLLYYIVARHPGSAHDSRVWSYSQARRWTEQRSNFSLAGISDILYS